MCTELGWGSSENKCIPFRFPVSQNWTGARTSNHPVAFRVVLVKALEFLQECLPVDQGKAEEETSEHKQNAR